LSILYEKSTPSYLTKNFHFEEAYFLSEFTDLFIDIDLLISIFVASVLGVSPFKLSLCVFMNTVQLAKVDLSVVPNIAGLVTSSAIITQFTSK
jgi:hypothetical protein